MNELSPAPNESEKMQSLKKWTALVYLCQVLTFGFAGLPLLIGAIINFIKREEVEGTWLESHFNWQVNTVWIVLAGFALAGITWTTGIGFLILIPTLMLLIYRIVIGWMALNADKEVKAK
ncbi:MAG: DUF4870 family protein [Gammaproteobacteria bacterium]